MLPGIGKVLAMNDGMVLVLRRITAFITTPKAWTASRSKPEPLIWRWHMGHIPSFLSSFLLSQCDSVRRRHFKIGLLICWMYDPHLQAASLLPFYLIANMLAVPLRDVLIKETASCMEVLYYLEVKRGGCWATRPTPQVGIPVILVL